jgi:hypothetical protein
MDKTADPYGAGCFYQNISFTTPPPPVSLLSSLLFVAA